MAIEVKNESYKRKHPLIGPNMTVVQYLRPKFKYKHYLKISCETLVVIPVI